MISELLDLIFLRKYSRIILYFERKRVICMALNKDVLVEMPAHCVRAKKDKAVYVQYTIRAYRNEKGKPTSERVSIGKEDPETGMLIPNRNYYEYVEKKKQMELPAFVRSCGTYVSFSGISAGKTFWTGTGKRNPDNSPLYDAAGQYYVFFAGLDGGNGDLWRQSLDQCWDQQTV